MKWNVRIPGSLSALLLVWMGTACQNQTTLGRGVLTVGPGGRFLKIAQAVEAAANGDTILVEAGQYPDESFAITRDLRLQGIGGFVSMRAPAHISNQKAVIVSRAVVVLENFEIYGARVPDKNGAAVRFETGTLTLMHCKIHDNEDGILTGVIKGGVLTVKDSEFADNGHGDGYSHGLYAGDIEELVVQNSTFRGTHTGHHIKSRARKTTIEDTLLDDGEGDASYNIDLPNGGKAVIRRNKLVQSAKSPNKTMVNFGGEGTAYADSSLLVEANNFVNRRKQGSIGVMNRTSVPALLRNNKFADVETILQGPGKIE